MINQRTSIKRTIGGLRYLLEKGQVAFYLGAGVDKLLVNDAKRINNNLKSPPGWLQMLQELYFYDQPLEKIHETFNLEEEEGRRWIEFFNYWPAEIATFVHWVQGSKKFYKQISNFENGSFKANINDEGTTVSLCQLLSKSNIILTTNYTNYIAKSLRKIYPKKEYIVLDREDLSGFIFPESVPCEDIKTIYIIHIHGRYSSKSFPILDAWGYNIAQYDDNSYLDILESLFRSRHVITLGTSWFDIPLRNTAGYINRKYPYLGRLHLGFYYREDFPKSLHGIDTKVAWSNTMNAIYGVNFIFVDDTTQKEAIQSLNEPLRTPQRPIKLCEIADFLDSTGDYESPLQHSLLIQLGHEENHTLGEYNAAKLGVKMIIRNLRSILDSDNVTDWEIAVRIERHLRHQIYLYPPTASNPNNLRREIWEVLFNNFKRNYERLIKLDEHLLFEFFTGVYEIANESSEYIPCFKDNNLNKRIEIAKSIWEPLPKSEGMNIEKLKKKIDSLECIGMKLLKMGWESMSAKVFSDKAFMIAKGINTFFNESKNLNIDDNFVLSYIDVLNETKRSEEISKVTGYLRRRIKVDVLEAIWNKEPKTARNRLLAQLQLKSQAISNMQIEPAMKNAIGIGLVVNQFRFEELQSDSKPVYETACNTLEEAGFPYPDDVLNEGNLNYWKEIIPKEISSKYNELRRERK